MNNIQPNELRIGNLVSVHNHYVAEILSIGLDKVGVKTIGEPNAQIDYFDYKYISGIQINENWLLKFRFDKNDNHYFLELMQFILENEVIKPAPYYFSEAFAQDLEIKYVHQLQNISFALNGEELTATTATNNGTTNLE